MELFNKAGGIIASVVLMVGMLIACQAKEDALPPAPVIEAIAQKLGEHGGAAAERRLREWSDQGSAVAMRELGLLYRQHHARRGEAIRLFERAAEAGDAESALRLTELYRGSVAAVPARPALALASLSRGGERGAMPVTNK